MANAVWAVVLWPCSFARGMVHAIEIFNSDQAFVVGGRRWQERLRGCISGDHLCRST